jgi:hypothetical protein
VRRASRAGAERDHAGIVEALLEHGADAEQVYAHSAPTPLSWALTTGALTAARALVRAGHGPDLAFRAYMGGTALHWAYFAGSRAVVTLLLDAGPDPTLRDDVHRCTPRAFGICVPASWGWLSKVRQRLAEDPALASLMDGPDAPRDGDGPTGMPGRSPP